MTKKLTHCPECNVVLPLGATYCRDCGNVFDDGKKAKGWDGQCEFRFKGRRCPLPGTVSDNLQGKGPWFCGIHARHKDKSGQQILQQLYAQPELVANYKKQYRKREQDIEAEIRKYTTTTKRSVTNQQTTLQQRVSNILQKYTTMTPGETK